jgi:hypothetical protein
VENRQRDHRLGGAAPRQHVAGRDVREVVGATATAYTLAVVGPWHCSASRRQSSLAEDVPQPDGLEALILISPQWVGLLRPRRLHTGRRLSGQLASTGFRARCGGSRSARSLPSVCISSISSPHACYALIRMSVVTLGVLVVIALLGVLRVRKAA